jgi:hypothetical protein
MNVSELSKLTEDQAREMLEKNHVAERSGLQLLWEIGQFARQGRIRKTSGRKFKSVHKNNEGPAAAAAEPLNITERRSSAMPFGGEFLGCFMSYLCTSFMHKERSFESTR